MSNVYRAARVSYSYVSDRPAVIDLSLTVDAAEFFAIIGPNGSGKSTLLKLLLGVLKPDAGTVDYRGRAALEWDRRDFARRVGVVAQIEELMFPLSARELVAMGRYPHLGPWQRERTVDRAAIERAMQLCDVTSLGDRLIQNLSGGERQRVRVARALAQQPDTLVLDEPSNALDLGHEMAVFELLHRLRSEHGMTVVVATHNINLASRFAQRLLLMHEGRAVACGSPADVLQSDTISATYQWPVHITPHPGPGPDTGSPQVIPVSSRSERQ